MAWFETPALRLAEQVREGQLSPVDLLEAHIRRIEAVNPVLNAVVNRRYDQARSEALEAQAAIERGDDVGPLHGVPCTIKEFIAVEGMPHTGGLACRRQHVAEQNASLVDRLQAAGAIVMGTTNGPEGGLWHETTNTIHGRTSNPHDLYRTSGGSSGGEGAIIAAGGSPFGIGSDVGGSIRIPAAFCGIYGHKPSAGVVPNTGHFPEAPEQPYMGCGPMTRSARDLMPLLRVLAGPDGTDPNCRPVELPDPEQVDLSDLTVWVAPTNGRASVRRPVRDAVERAGQLLGERGATVRRLETRHLQHSFEIWAVLMSEVGSYESIVTEGGKVRLARELSRWLRGRSRHTGSVLAMVGLQRVLDLLPDQTDRMRAVRDELRSELEAVLGDDGILLHPTFARLAPRHRTIGIGNPTDVGPTAVFNILGFPGTVAPVGTHQGLPTAVQILGRRGADHLTIAAAIALEDAIGGWRPVTPRRGRRPRMALA